MFKESNFYSIDKFPFDKIAAVLEYKVMSAEAEDDVGATVDVSGSGIYAGIGFSF